MAINKSILQGEGGTMNYQQAIRTGDMAPGIARSSPASDTGAAVLSVLSEIRAVQANGRAYGMETNLSGAGFTSIEMVKVMLAIEAAFDLMIPQQYITPEHFASPGSITSMMLAVLAIG